MWNATVVGFSVMKHEINVIHPKTLEKLRIMFRFRVFPFPILKKKTPGVEPGWSDRARGHTQPQLLSEILNHWSELWCFQVLLKTLLQLVLITSSTMTTREDEEGLLSAVSIFFCQIKHRCDGTHIAHRSTTTKEFGRPNYRQPHRKHAAWLL